ncbi:MAG: HAD-IA family hydrolase [Limisphaerales bacterium]
MPDPYAHIEAVTFDVGGTLIAPHPSVGAIYARVAARHGNRGLSEDILNQRFAAAWSHARPFQHGREEWARLVDRVFDGLVRQPPSLTFFPELYAEFSKAGSWRVFEDVVPTLESLAALGLDLGIISNWDDRLRPLLRDLRLDRYFSSILVSCETGFAKPSPVIYQEALRRLGRPASSVLHVGDELQDDFAGATTAGFSALHLRRETPPADLQIQSLSEVATRFEAR